MNFAYKYQKRDLVEEIERAYQEKCLISAAHRESVDEIHYKNSDSEQCAKQGEEGEFPI